jgi:hypothetical protein
VIADWQNALCRDRLEPTGCFTSRLIIRLARTSTNSSAISAGMKKKANSAGLSIAPISLGGCNSSNGTVMETIAS